MSDFATVLGGYDPAALKKRALTLLCDSYCAVVFALLLPLCFHTAKG